MSRTPSLHRSSRAAGVLLATVGLASAGLLGTPVAAVAATGGTAHVTTAALLTVEDVRAAGLDATPGRSPAPATPS